MSAVQTLPIALTSSALAELKNLHASEESTEKGLRIGVKGGGCSGLSYVLEFDAQNDMDAVYEIEGLRILVDPRHVLYIQDMEVDFQAGLNDRGFIFNNPNAESTCGCGTSFSA